MYHIKIIYVPKYSYIILKFIKNEIPFSIHRISSSRPLSAAASLVLCHFETWLFGLFGSTHGVTCWRQEVSPDLLGLCSPSRLKRQRYSSEREREMRGPFLISFLFSSFLLLFSSSLRIFLNASAVWSTCSEMALFDRQPDLNWRYCRLQDGHVTHVVSLCAVWIHKVWSFLCYSELLWHLNTQSEKREV